MKSWKKPLSLLCAAAMVCSLAACGPKEPKETPDAGIYTPGTYEGTAQGYGGTVTAKITVDANSITSVTITGPDETPSIGGAALSTLEANALAKGADMDGVAGASMTSDAAKAAVAAALAKAKR